MIQLPWQANIYRKSCDSCLYEYVCGGTIVNAKVVVTARGCFKNLENGTDYNLQNYVVSVAKLYRDFYDSFDANNQQNLTIKTVNYREGPTYYKDNIATITLDGEIVWTNGVLPICLNDNHQIDDKAISRGIVGHFGTGGNSDDDFSHVMNIASLDVVEPAKCISKMPPKIHQFFNTEQHCLKYEVERKYVRHSVMGEGLAMRTLINDQRVYFLKGVISNQYNFLDIIPSEDSEESDRENEYMIVSDAFPTLFQLNNL